MYTKTKRYCSKKFFLKTTVNGEQILRKWLVYSTLKNIFCVVCKLFGDDSQFGNQGFNDWKIANERILHHENSKNHKDYIKSFSYRQRENGRIDTKLCQEIIEEKQYWTAVLTRVIEIIKFLAYRGLSFRGSNEHLNSLSNGNFLGAVELLTKFDPFLADHCARYGNIGR